MVSGVNISTNFILVQQFKFDDICLSFTSLALFKPKIYIIFNFILNYRLEFRHILSFNFHFLRLTLVLNMFQLFTISTDLCEQNVKYSS